MNKDGEMLSTTLYIERNEKEIALLCEALGSETRVKILKHLQIEPNIYTVPELSKVLNIPITTLVHHLKKLENAGIIDTRYKSSSHGAIKVVSRKLRHLKLDLYKYVNQPALQLFSQTQTLKIGEYSDFVGNNFNYATDKELYSYCNTPFFSGRDNIGLIFTYNGIITYNFSNAICKDYKINSLNFSLELCSEAPYYDNTYKSDITFWLNDKELCTFLSEGDYGDRKGRQNPDWWNPKNTQYGKLISLTINNKGVFVNGICYNDKINVGSFSLSKGNKISFSFGNKPTSEYIGGFNLFGSCFGDYPQDLILITEYEK